jgi:hypothetical protein
MLQTQPPVVIEQPPVMINANSDQPPTLAVKVSGEAKTDSTQRLRQKRVFELLLPMSLFHFFSSPLRPDLPAAPLPPLLSSPATSGTEPLMYQWYRDGFHLTQVKGPSFKATGKRARKSRKCGHSVDI